jgi:apolipoprotein N-acyltransferase
VSTACFAPLLSLKIEMTRTEEAIVAALGMLLPTGIAALWLFRKLQARYTQREARAVTIAFAVLTPISLLIAFPLAQIPGGYAEVFLGRPFAPIAAFTGVILVTVCGSFVSTAVVLWMTRRISALESNIFNSR